MPTQYNGLAANTLGTLPVSVPISSSTNTTPIVITTSSAHGLKTGDTVNVNNHLVNTNANGISTVTVLSPTTFSIPSAGNGVGGATGTVQSLALGATYQIPSDGDSFSASAFNTAFVALGDRTAFLGSRLGNAKLAGRVHLYLANATPSVSSTWSSATAAASATWTDMVGNLNFLSDNTGTGLGGPLSVVAAGNTSFQIGGFSSIDFIHVQLLTTANNSQAPCAHRLRYSFPSIGLTPLPGASCWVNSTIGSVTLDGWIVPGATGIMTLIPQIYPTAGGTTNGTFAYDANLLVEAWRPTLMPQ